MWPIGLRFRLLASLALAAALVCGAAGAAPIDAETPDYLVPDSPAATIERQRGADGRLRIEIHGTHLDGRRLVERLLATIRQQSSAPADRDFDLHIAVGALAGFNREVLYDVDLRLTRRGGRIDDFALTGRTRDKAAVRGGVRDAANAHRTLYLEAHDAGAFLRFVDLYGKLTSGTMWLTLNLPALQDGTFHIRDFDLPNEPILQPLRRASVPLLTQLQDVTPVPSRLHGHFNLSPGKVVVKDTAFENDDGAAIMEGLIERGELNMRGLLAPAVLNDPRDPLCSTRCLQGMQYRLTGPLAAPKLVINPFMTPVWKSLLPP
jgi:hypothetical protein